MLGGMTISQVLRWMVPSLALVVGCKGDEGGSSSTGTESTAGTTTAGTTTAGTTTDEPTTGVTGGMTSGSTGEGTSGGPGGGACEAYNKTQVMVAERICTCAVEAGDFPDVQSCLEILTEPPADAMCRCDTLAAFPESDAAYQCVVDASPALVMCLEAAACGDQAAQMACFDAFEMVAGQCPEPSKQADGAVGLQCQGEPAFMCTSGEQVPEYFTCDMEMDCKDGSDEAKDKCIFTCTDGQEVPSYSKCDGVPDCMDMSDEPSECYFMCMSGESVLKEFVCDGFDDCMDGSDEVGDCTFMCGSGEEVPKAYVCDMEPDCMDGSDEANCP